jgi:AraC-like DNA-binding protein
MFSFEYTYNDYELLVGALAAKMNVQVKDGWLFFPNEYANGYIRYLKLPNGLQVNIINCKNTTEWLFSRKGDMDEYYTLRFDDITIPKSLSVDIGGDLIEKKNQRVSVAYLTSSLFSWSYKAAPGTSMRGVNILLPKEWLGKMLGIELFQNILPAYVDLKAKSFNMEQLDVYYLELLEEILSEDPDTRFPKLYVLNRVQLLLERFFNHIQTRVSLADVESKLKADDINTIIQLGRQMTDDFKTKPVSINDLARKAAMSTTKFKNLFKVVYGLPVYEYYQQQRMQKASELLQSGNNTVKQTGLQIGYSNLSNFSAAFKKQFGVTPQEYLAQ